MIWYEPGKRVEHTWTTLAETVVAGSNTIEVLEDVSDWPVGSEIVIATTGHKHSQGESEKHVIAAVSEDGHGITLQVIFV